MLFYSHFDVSELFLFANRACLKVATYIRSHKLSLHPKKTQFIIFSNSRAVQAIILELYVNNNNLPDPFNPDLSKTNVCITNDSPVPAAKFLTDKNIFISDFRIFV